MKKIRLEIVGLSSIKSQPDWYNLVLAEVDGNRRLPIVIGKMEASAIAFIVENIEPDRPMMYQLFKFLGDSFDLNLKEVIISDLIAEEFYCKMIWSDGLNEKEIAACPSDAIAIAMRGNAPIYSYESVLKVAGVLVKDKE